MAYATDGISAAGVARQPAGFRKPARLDVKLYCHSFPYLYCKAETIGHDGLFVDCDLRNLPTHAYLEVEFELNDNGTPRRYRLPVYVDSTSTRGANLLFSFPEENGLGIPERRGH